jgi:hypothetical protein
MKQRSSAVLSLVAMLVLGLPARPAGAGVTVSVEKIKGLGMQAVFEYATDDNCIVAFTTIDFSESVTRQDGQRTVTGPLTQVTLDYSDTCTSEFFELTGSTTTQTEKTSGDLGKASLAAVVPVTDGTLDAEITIDITWTANAPLVRDRSTTTTRDLDTITVVRDDAETRSADVAGTVAALLPVLGGPTDFDLSEFRLGGSIVRDINTTRTVTYLHGHP